MKPIGIGIIGLGRAGWGMHCRELEGREAKFTIVAACEEIEERRDRMNERYGCAVYATVDELIADAKVELVDVASRSCDHLAHASKALAAGKDVFVEKPICVSHDEAKQLLSASQASKGTLYVRHNRRFDPDFIEVKQIVDSGILGEVYEIRLARHGYQRRDDWQTIKRFGGGQLLNWGPHIIDHALRFIDGKLKRQWSYLNRVAAVGDAEDHVKIILEGQNGRVIDLEISGGVAIGEPEYRVFGTRGSLALSGNEISLKYLDPEIALQEKQPDPGTPGTTFGSTETLSWVELKKPLQPGNNHVIWDELYSAIREGTHYPISLQEALQVMEVVTAAKAGTDF